MGPSRLKSFVWGNLSVAQCLPLLTWFPGCVATHADTGSCLFCWSSICVTSLVCYMTFPDRSVLPTCFWDWPLSITMGAIIRCAPQRQMAACFAARAGNTFGPPCGSVRSSEGAQPKFHRIEMRTTQTAKGAKSATTVLEEIEVLWQSPGKQQTCVCCLEDYKSEDLVTLLPCGHFFHESCHADWLNLEEIGQCMSNLP